MTKQITIEVSEDYYESLEKEAARTGWRIDSLLIRWIEHGMLNARPILGLRCSKKSCENPKPNWRYKHTHNFYCSKCATKFNKIEPGSCRESPLVFDESLYLDESLYHE